jgi:protein disulfide-isomerase A6
VVRKEDQLVRSFLTKDYNGAREAKPMAETLLAAITKKYVKSIGGKAKSSPSIEDFTNEKAGELAKVILFTDKSNTPDLYKALSVSYKDRLLFGEIKKAKTDLVEKFKVEKFPTVLVIPKEVDAKPVVHTGSIKSADIKAFLDKYAVELPKKEKAVKKEKPAKKESKDSKKKKEEKPAREDL